MVTISETVYVDVELDEFEDDEIVDYMQGRGYIITKDPLDASFVDIAWNVDQGNLKEALILLEREVPKLSGISRLVE